MLSPNIPFEMAVYITSLWLRYTKTSMSSSDITMLRVKLQVAGIGETPFSCCSISNCQFCSFRVNSQLGDDSIPNEIVILIA